MHPALKLAGASCRLAARASIALTRFALLRVEETFKTDLNENRSSYYDAIHEDDDDLTV
jgi:hypothetical protein|tara:strand:- start:801 stop:977 length:177 start_codon:yes stop_codon:yes gene_type:complete